MDIRSKIQSLKQGKSLRGLGIGDILPIAVALVAIVIVIAVGALILAGFQTSGNLVANSVASNTVVSGLSALGTFGTYLPLLALVVIAAIIVGVVIAAFAFGHHEGGGPRV